MDYRRLFVPNSTVFITFVTSKRRNILISNINLLKNSIKFAVQKYNCEIIAICVMKNHIHILLKPKNIKDYPTIIKEIKTNFSKNINKQTIENYSESISRKSKKESDIWQRRYYEHTIRDEEDLYRHIDYIHFNSEKHYGIAPKNWEYSSFSKFVKLGWYESDWCNFGDRYCIDKLDYE